MTTDSLQIEDHFPFSEIRPAQRRALEAMMKAEQLNKRFIIMELPTGVGKSGIAWAIASWSAAHREPGVYQPGGYILTTQKSLQAQYGRDFSQLGLCDIKGSNNYQCAEWDTDCSAGAKLSKATGNECNCECPYKSAKWRFIKAPIGVTNFSYFLNDSRYVKSLPKRRALIIDEAHNAEKEILGFADVEITKHRAASLDLDLPVFEQGETVKAIEWLNTHFLPAGEVEEERMKIQIRQYIHDDERDKAIELSARHDALDKYLCKVRRFQGTNPEDWFTYTDSATGSLVMKPLSASLFSEELLFDKGKRIIMMSATILDKKSFIRSLGIEGSQAGFLRLESEFPVENRLIHFYPMGKMSAAHQDKTIPAMLKMVEKILRKHSNEKGIIHCQSYKIQKIIADHFEGTPHGSRLLTHTSKDRNDVINYHVRSEDPTILLSPSMTEGLDLRDDLSRFQIITKVPFPYIGDAFIKARMDRDPSWYMWQTALTLVQATGRSIRSATDSASTYILDSDFGYFLSRADSILPDWWKESVVYHN